MPEANRGLDGLANWSGHHRYRATGLHRPRSVAEVQELVRRSDRVKGLGTRHCFNDIADTPGALVSCERLNRLVAVDAATATVEPGMRYADLGPLLDAEGLALHNLASLPHISVAGACATATHGSGVKNGNLATAVTALDLVKADGDLVRLRRGDTAFNGAVVGLGGLGLVTALTLDLKPAFTMRQDVYSDLPLAEVIENLDAVLAMAYSVCLFTNWRSRKVAAWAKRRIPEEDTAPELLGCPPSSRPQHPVPGNPTEHCTEQLGRPGPWHERLPHFRPDQVPSVGDELQSEYFVPRQHGPEAMRAIAALADRIAPVLHVSEIRAVAADRLWMSPNYDQDSVALHFTWKKNWPAVKPLLEQIEAALAPWRARPHWGKLFAMPPAQLQSLYGRLPDFKALLAQYDPQGKFRNPFLENYLLS